MIYIFLEKMVELFANSGDPDQMPHTAASDLDLYCLPVTHLRVSRLRWVKVILPEFRSSYIRPYIQNFVVLQQAVDLVKCFTACIWARSSEIVSLSMRAIFTVLP